jgi:3-oxoacyl-[acyl-carrier-protein] synthase-3
LVWQQRAPRRCASNPGRRPASAPVSLDRGTTLIYSRIAGTGSYLPEKIVTNADMEKLVDTTDEWIASRTGIRERRFAADGETTGDLAFYAATHALDAAGIKGAVSVED